MRLPLHEIVLVPELQVRETISDESIKDFAEAMRGGDVFPDVVVFQIDGRYYLADGFHRYYATQELGKTGIKAIVKKGTMEDAIVFAAGANKRNGIPLDFGDKVKAVRMLLGVPAWRRKANLVVAGHVGCARTTVSTVRRDLEVSGKIEYEEQLESESGRMIGRKSEAPSVVVTDEFVGNGREDPLPPDPVPYSATWIDVTPTRAAPAGPVMFSVAEWEALSAGDQAAALDAGFASGKHGFREQNSELVEWAQYTWNPITGCLHNCIYCYAREIAERLYTQQFVPTLIPERLAMPANTPISPDAETDVRWRNVFTGSMADLFGRWVPQGWIDAVFTAMQQAPQWNFLVLTKFPKRMAELEWPQNVWAGTSIDNQARVPAAEEAFANVRAGVRWLSLEPMLTPLKFKRLDLFDWIVIGAQKRTKFAPEFQPQWEWIEDVLWQAREAGCNVYFKDNLTARPTEIGPRVVEAPSPEG